MTAISVVIPVYNGARYLRETLDSVRWQTRQPDEIIVVDDGSTDDTPEILQAETGIQVIRQENQGAGAARNRGIQHATGELIAFLDADDIWLPEKLEIQARELETNPTTGYILCGILEFHSPDMSGEMRQKVPVRNMDKPATLPSTALLRASCFEQVGLFDPRWRTGEFMDWILRAREHQVQCMLLDTPLVKRRIHDANLGRQAAAATDYHRIIKAALDRKRKRQDRGKP